MFQRFKDYGIILSPKKCSLFKKTRKYMGYVVSANVMEPNDVKVLKDKQWPTPTKPEEFRKFQRFVAYYRKLLRYFF